MKSFVIITLWSYCGYIINRAIDLGNILKPWASDVWEDFIVSGPSDMLKFCFWYVMSIAGYAVYKKWIEGPLKKWTGKK